MVEEQQQSAILQLILTNEMSNPKLTFSLATDNSSDVRAELFFSDFFTIFGTPCREPWRFAERQVESLPTAMHKERINGGISQFHIDKVVVCIIILKCC